MPTMPSLELIPIPLACKISINAEMDSGSLSKWRPKTFENATHEAAKPNVETIIS